MNDTEYGDFEEIGDEQAVAQNNGEGVQRIRMPKGEEKIGLIIQRYGGNRMDVKTSDGKNRNCRVPGRYKRRLWLRPGDYILIVPWKDDDDKGDVIFKYTPSQVAYMKKKRLLQGLEESF